MRLRWILMMGLSSLVACSSGDSSGADRPSAGLDSGAVDAAAADADALDAAFARDAPLEPDAGAIPDVGTSSDAGVLADSGVPPDSGAFPDAAELPDVGTSSDAGARADTGPWDGGAACDYIDVMVAIVSCPGGYEYVREFVDTNQNPACAGFSMLFGNRYPTTLDAIHGEGCSDTCVYRASMSVSFIDPCGHRNGYIVFAAPSCPDLYEFAEGLFPSRAAWEEALHCGG
ncbi:MAG: hypothetical protein U1E65_01030 [Myxococcota bacterium]